MVRLGNIIPKTQSVFYCKVGGNNMDIQTEQKIFTDNIIYLRKIHGYSKKQMAEILKISQYHLNLIEKGTIPERLNVRLLVRIQNVFHISLRDQFSPLKK